MPTAMALMTAFGKRRPKTPFSTKPDQRKNGNEPELLHRLVLKRTDLVDFECLAIFEDRQDDGQAHGGFGRGDHHHEETENVPVDLFELVGKRDEAEIHGVEHQLDGHEHSNDVAAEQESGDAEREQNRAQDQIPGERNALRDGNVAALVDLLARQHDGAQNRDQDQDAGDFKGQQ